MGKGYSYLCFLRDRHIGSRSSLFSGLFCGLGLCCGGEWKARGRLGVVSEGRNFTVMSGGETVSQGLAWGSPLDFFQGRVYFTSMLFHFAKKF
jgi:hypothetical protein